jgi:hypothetical protein
MAAHPAAQHFVQGNTESPEIGFKAVIVIREDFRRRECRCANKALRFLDGPAAEQPSSTKIAENNVTICVDKDVLGLNVSMYDSVSMNMLDSNKLRCWIRRCQIIDLAGGLQVLPCRIVLLPG